MMTKRTWSILEIAFAYIIAIMVPLLHMARERTIYVWDHATYHKLATSLYTAFSQSWLSGWHSLYESFAWDYNRLFAIPLVPWTALFGTVEQPS